MSLAIDANVLIDAVNVDGPSYERAAARLQRALDSEEPVFLFWPVVMAFLRVTTHPAVFPVPLPFDRAVEKVESLLALANVRITGERDGFWEVYKEVTGNAGVRGKLVHDAHIVALMRQHEVRTILTSDRDFRRFDGIRVVNPLV